jgi:hypothetical protein
MQHEVEGRIVEHRIETAEGVLQDLRQARVDRTLIIFKRGAVLLGEQPQPLIGIGASE